MSDALINRGGLLTFAHDFLRVAVENAYVPAEKSQRAVHLRLADYFASQPKSPRRTFELPWQLASASAWQRLNDLLADSGFLIDAYPISQFDIKAWWAQIEANSPLRMVDAYRSQIARPQTESIVYLLLLSGLMGSTGHPEEALCLIYAMAAFFRGIGDLYGLAGCLNDQAVILTARGDLNGALALNTEVEKLYRQLGLLDAVENLAKTLINLALVLLKMRRGCEGLPLAEEAHRLAEGARNTAPAQQFERILNAVRQSAQSEALSGKTAAGLGPSAGSMVSQCEPVEAVAPVLITALLNAHETLSPAAVARIETLLSQLESTGHSSLAAPLREKVTVKLVATRPKKQWWKILNA
jgi:tetratricopeptide (TPR) repeat protein